MTDRILRVLVPFTLALGCFLACSGPGNGEDSGSTGGGSTGAQAAGGQAADLGSGGQPAGGSGGTPGATGGAAGGTVGAGGALGGADGSGGITFDVEGTSCRFFIEQTLSSEISTVGIVNWATDLPSPVGAQIEFGPAGNGRERVAKANLASPLSRTLLLGLKAETEYSFTIVLEGGDVVCESPETTFTTGPLPDWVPIITKVGEDASAAKGFIVTTPGLALLTDSRGLPSAYIFDTDGDLVWWTPETVEDICRATMSWDGQKMWFVNGYGRDLFSVTMDGLTVQQYPVDAHHDVTALPDGAVATFSDGSLIELRPDGTQSVIVEDLEALVEGLGAHFNAVHYHPVDDSFTVSERNTSAFVKVSRTGELLWVLGGEDVPSSSLSLVGLEGWESNHGHHLTVDGRFLFFNNERNESGLGDFSGVFELQIDEENGTATKVWDYATEPTIYSPQLGDVERLPNGNVLVTYSNSGLIEEVTPEGEVLQSFDNSDSFENSTTGFALFGYAAFRTSLYGPPPR